jgi:ribosomal peptide maturation radical SAM protein 1
MTMQCTGVGGEGLMDNRPSDPSVAGIVRQAEVLLVVPPFALHDRPALGIHILQAIARKAGFEAQVLYANLLFCSRFGESIHGSLSQGQVGLFLGERLFARSAYSGPALGRDGGRGLKPTLEQYRRVDDRFPDFASVKDIEEDIPNWLESFVPDIAAESYQVVGCTSSFEQNAASIAILSSVKKRRPETITLIGGANCEGEMAKGVLTLSDKLDYVFSGESEETFRDFLLLLGCDQLPAGRIIEGRPYVAMDELPTPDYSDYYEQVSRFLPESPLVKSNKLVLNYETSRGCWWGQKSHCTFCGLNGQGMVSREKSPERVIAELQTLLTAHPNRSVFMTDNIMPHAYFHTLLPRLRNEVPDVKIMYEEKANLSLEKVRELVDAGVQDIQPGIEALSTGLLKLMAKGTTAGQNIALLRYAKATGLRLHWNLLVGFPNDELQFYMETLDALPLIHHLQYPSVCPVIFDRFSPYFDYPERYEIRNLRPMDFYGEVLPEAVDVRKVAYHFQGDFRSAISEHFDVFERIVAAVAEWRRRATSRFPAELSIERRGPRTFRLCDTRGLAKSANSQVLDEEQATMVLVSRPAKGAPGEIYKWAKEHELVIERDGRIVPLATARPELLEELEGRARRLRSKAVSSMH